eukprot:g44991.t1
MRSGPVTYKVQVSKVVQNKHMDHMKAATLQMGQDQNIPGSSELLASPMLLIVGHLVRRGAGRSEYLLVGLFLGLAKLAINRSRQRATEGIVSADWLPLFRGYARVQVSLERSFQQAPRHNLAGGKMGTAYETLQVGPDSLHHHALPLKWPWREGHMAVDCKVTLYKNRKQEVHLAKNCKQTKSCNLCGKVGHLTVQDNGPQMARSGNKNSGTQKDIDQDPIDEHPPTQKRWTSRGETPQDSQSRTAPAVSVRSTDPVKRIFVSDNCLQPANCHLTDE